ncbi:hypothetical protein NDN16_18885 [Aureimonas altamirensis]|uniref:hypothetical protein n=1 Tax=Aureimonas altamirensis TaxID=370622 RepID=UPI002036AF8F|nr:hypothetical protein [Aureimonas altamirensis]MCM2505731.1 hypothetical protein [Aureimonas altamirensis]
MQTPYITATFWNRDIAMAASATRFSLAALAACLILGGCGMSRAVTVAPQTMDDLARQTEPFRQGRAAE